MKTIKLKYRDVLTAILLIFVAGCDNKIEQFEQIGSIDAPVAIKS